MYLFTKRTRNIIKGIWAVLAILVMISMVVAYSGFTSLFGTQQPTTVRDVAPEDLVSPTTSTTSVDVSTLSTSSPEIQELLRSIEADMASGTETGGETGTLPTATPPAEPPVPQLNFGI